MNIIECIQQQVDKIIANTYSKDECKPVFTVSLLYEHEENKKDDNDHKIILTVQHMGSAFSKVIFPQTSNVFGYDSLQGEMKYMYNRTM